MRGTRKGEEIVHPYRMENCRTSDNGYIQLAIRSGQYKKLNAMAIKEGELINYDPLNEEIEVRLIEDELERESAPTIGYYAMFEYLNGFHKAIYWSKDKMMAHANKYSQGFRARKGYTFWEKDFDGMAIKTMLRQLISKWGVMSIEFQKAYEADMGVVRDDTVEYVDNTDDENILKLDPVTEADYEIVEAEVVKEGADDEADQLTMR